MNKTHLTLVQLWFGHVVNVIILCLLVMSYCIDTLVFFCCMQYLNTNHTLYDAVRKAEQENHLLTEEAQRVSPLPTCWLWEGCNPSFCWYVFFNCWFPLLLQPIFSLFENYSFLCFADKLDRVNQLNIEISQLCRE